MLYAIIYVMIDGVMPEFDDDEFDAQLTALLDSELGSRTVTEYEDKPLFSEQQLENQRQVVAAFNEAGIDLELPEGQDLFHAHGDELFRKDLESPDFDAEKSRMRLELLSISLHISNCMAPDEADESLITDDIDETLLRIAENKVLPESYKVIAFSVLKKL